MHDYRIYGLDPRGGFVSVHELQRASDAEAIRAACALSLPNGFELWQRGRPVARVPPNVRPSPTPR